MGAANLEVDGKTLSQACLGLCEGILSVFVDAVEVGDAISGEEGSGHRPMESAQWYWLPKFGLVKHTVRTSTYRLRTMRSTI